jgi:hypothetical protein
MTLPLPAPASAQAAAAAPFLEAAPVPEHVRPYLERPRATGPARLTWLGFHVYDAHLYTGAGFDPAQPTASAFALELTYARKLEGKAIAETSREEIARMKFSDEASHARWFEQMRRLFPDVGPGSRIAGVNLPGRGARFYVDGRFAGSIDEPDFARAFFAIWLDERTRAPKVRARLLGLP